MRLKKKELGFKYIILTMNAKVHTHTHPVWLRRGGT